MAYMALPHQAKVRWRCNTLNIIVYTLSSDNMQYLVAPDILLKLRQITCKSTYLNKSKQLNVNLNCQWPSVVDQLKKKTHYKSKLSKSSVAIRNVLRFLCSSKRWQTIFKLDKCFHNKFELSNINFFGIFAKNWKYIDLWNMLFVGSILSKIGKAVDGIQSSSYRTRVYQRYHYVCLLTNLVYMGWISVNYIIASAVILFIVYDFIKIQYKYFNL